MIGAFLTLLANSRLGRRICSGDCWEKASGALVPKSEAGAGGYPGVQTPQPGEVPASSAPALIPKADAELAVALAYDRASYNAWSSRAGVDGVDRPWLEWVNEQSRSVAHEVSREIMSATLALAPTDALAELNALRAGLDALRDELDITNRMLMAEANASLERLTRAEAAEAEVARLTGENAELRADYYSAEASASSAQRKALIWQGCNSQGNSPTKGSK